MVRRGRSAFEGPEGPERRGFRHKKAGFREPAFSCNGGEGGIRTLGTLARSLDFESSPFGLSGTSPNRRYRIRGIDFMLNTHARLLARQSTIDLASRPR